MKKPVLIFVFALLLSVAYSQKYGIKLEVDEFTSDSVLTSEWVVLNDPIWKGGRISYVRISKEGQQLILQLKLTTGGDIALVDNGDKFYIKLENSEVLQFTNTTPVISSKGGGAIKLRGSSAEGVTLLFNLSNDDLLKLTKSEIAKIRVTTSSGNIEVEPETIKYKKALLDYFLYFEQYLSK